MSFNEIFPNIKLQLKARFRFSSYLNENQKIPEKPPFEEEEDNNNYIENGSLSTSKKSKKRQSFISNYHKYIIKTNLLRKVILNMPFKKIYKYEKDCSLKCEDSLKEIKIYCKKLNIPLLPAIKRKSENIKNASENYIKINKLNESNHQNDKTQNSEDNLVKSNSMPSIFSLGKIYKNIKHNKKKINKICINNANNEKKNMSSIFNYKNNFEIIKGGGIKFNNSIYRIKDMNILVHSKPVKLQV